MKRMASAAAVVCAAAVTVAFFGCPGNGGNNGGEDAGLDANDIPFEDPIIKVSGVASLHPEAKAWLMSKSMTVPSIEGLTHRVEEPLKAAFDDPLGIFGTRVLDATGAYGPVTVDTANVNLGIAGGILDLRDGGPNDFVRTATTIHDVTLAGEKPQVDINNSKTFILPRAFVDQLTAAVTPAAIDTLNNHTVNDAGMSTGTLEQAGFIFGQVVDAQGNPVTGVKLTASVADFNKRFYYPSADYTTATTTGTSANGSFVFVGNEATTPTPFTFKVEGKSEYLNRNGGTKAGTGLIVVVFPGKTAP